MRRRISSLALLVALVSVGLLAGPGNATAAPREFFGLVPQGTEGDRDIERMAQAGVGRARFPIDWPGIEGADDSFGFAALDAWVGDLARAGIRPFPTLFGTAPFVSPDPVALPVKSTQAKEQWQEFVRTVAGRYGPGGSFWSQNPSIPQFPITTWQVWNEQNGPKHAQPKPSSSAYAELLKITHRALTEVDPGAEIVLGGMFGTPRGKGGIKAWKFLKRLYKTKGVKSAFDGVAIHPYSPDVKGISTQIERFRQVLKQKRDKKADLWVTELGWGSSPKGRLGVGTKKQAKLLKKSFKLLQKRRGKWNIGGVMWYTWRDLPAGESPCDWCRTAGLFPDSGFDNPKPAFKQFVRFTGGS
jgi:hypothetical protein